MARETILTFLLYELLSELSGLTFVEWRTVLAAALLLLYRLSAGEPGQPWL